MNSTPPEVLEKWRAEFEREIYPHFKMTDPPHDKRLDGGKYFYAHMNLAWAAFCIARQSVRIKLPQNSIWKGIDAEEYIEVEDIKSAIESQGYTANN